MESWLSPMLCASADVVPEGPDWVLEGKLDGWRGVAHVTPASAVRLYGGRNGNSYSGKVPYIEDELLRLLPPDSAVDGELIGVGWGDVQGVMTRGNGPHVPSAHVPALSYVLFDVTRLGGSDLRREPWEDRRSRLEALFLPVYPDTSTGRAAFEPKWKHLTLSPTGVSSAASHEAMLALGLEGSVCKRRSAPYVGGRSNYWVKVKPQSTVEATVIGFKNSDVGSHVGAFIVRLESGTTTTVKCGTQARHESATRERDGQPDEPAWLGAVIEVKHHGIGSSGVPRHPQFLRRRDDRTAPAVKPRTAERTTRMSAPPRMRNYGAMGDDKLLRCIDELENGGDARDRVIAKGGDVAADLEVARNVAAARGLA